MSDKQFDIPAMAQSVDPAIRNPFTRMREALQTLLGTRGDGQDAAVTVRNAGALGGGTTTIIVGGDGGAGSTTPDLTPPPSVTGLSAVAGFSEVLVTWAAATYTQGHGHLQTNIYAAKRVAGDPDATFSDAALVYSATGALTIAEIPSEMNTRWHLWAKWKTVDGVESTAPAGGTNGVIVTTGQDITQLLDVLTGSITESQLYAALGARIDLIDGAGAGSVNARIATETTARSSADSSLASSLSTVAASTATNAAAISSESTARASADSSLASSIATVSASAGTNTAAISTEQTARISADSLLFAQYTVKLDVNGYVSGFGLASTGTGAAPFSSFIIRADNFSIANPSGPGITPIVPFIVRTTAGTVNGVAYPAGVYMDAAFILDLSAAIARMGSAWIDTAKIADLAVATAKLGNLSVTNAKIQNAAIDTAKIDDLAVTTIKIAGNAVTIPVTGSLVSDQNLYSGGPSAWFTVASASLDPQGQPVRVAANVAFRVPNTLIDVFRFNWRLTRDGTLLQSGVINVLVSNNGGTLTHHTHLPFTDSSPAAGTNSYSLEVFPVNSGGSGQFSVASLTNIFLLGLKR